MMIEVMPQARQMFDELMDVNTVREHVMEAVVKSRRIHEDNAAVIQGGKTVTTTATIEIALTKTGMCITCLKVDLP